MRKATAAVNTIARQTKNAGRNETRNLFIGRWNQVEKARYWVALLMLVA